MKRNIDRQHAKQYPQNSSQIPVSLNVYQNQTQEINAVKDI